MAYFYFDFRDLDKQNCRNLLLSLLIQLSTQSGPCCDVLHHLYLEHDKGARAPSDAVMAQCLKDMLAIPNQPPIYLILDALDECPNSYGIPSPREQVLTFVKELMNLRLPHLHICVTSRPEFDIRATLGPLAIHSVSLHDESGQQKDIVDYVNSVVFSESETMMKRWRDDDKKMVVESLSEKADGMYEYLCFKLVTRADTSEQVSMGVLSARNTTTMSSTKRPTYSERTSGITRRDIRAGDDGNQEGQPIARVSNAPVSHGGESTSFRRGTCGTTRI
jgi:hypothetical protein